MKNGKYEAFKKRVSDIIEVGYVEDFVGRAYDVFNLTAILINLAVSVLMTYSGFNSKYGGLLGSLEAFTVAFFAIDYVLRLWTSSYLYQPQDLICMLFPYYCMPGYSHVLQPHSTNTRL